MLTGARKSAELTFATRRLRGSRGYVFVSGDSDAGGNDWLKVNVCFVGPFFVSTQCVLVRPRYSEERWRAPTRSR